MSEPEVPPTETQRGSSARPFGFLRGLATATLIAMLAGIALLGGGLAGAAFKLFQTEAPTTSARSRCPSVVVAMKDLARLEATTFHMERVIDLTETQQRFKGLITVKDAILLVAAGDVVGGVDLSGHAPRGCRSRPG